MVEIDARTFATDNVFRGIRLNLIVNLLLPFPWETELNLPTFNLSVAFAQCR